jgi:hypothetical protein
MTRARDLESRLTAGNTTIPTHHADAARRLCTRTHNDDQAPAQQH